MIRVIRAAGLSRAGPGRAINEDAWWMSPPAGLFAVADGIRGEQAGEEATRIALESVSRLDREIRPEDMIRAANQAVRNASAGEPALHKMGCALLVAAWRESGLTLAHAGDVRAYLVRGQTIKLLTHDHSVAAELARRGSIAPNDIRAHPLRHRLRQAVGRSSQIQPEVVSVDLQVRDRIILCTDGLWGVLSDADLQRLANYGYLPARAARQLIEAGIEAKATDDMTAIVLFVEEVSARIESAFLQRYELRCSLGRGNLAAVYGGLDRIVGREVALKVLHADALGERAIKRFEREARVLAKVDHPNVVSMYDVQLDSDSPYLVMPYVTGTSLQARLAHSSATTPLSVVEAVDITHQVASALQAVHRQQIIHRDLKPANILLTTANQVKLLDFGLARVPRRFDNLGQLTTHRRRIGSGFYQSPEQRRGETLDARSDLYALGIILYQMLTDQLPHPFNLPPVQQPGQPSLQTLELQSVPLSMSESLTLPSILNPTIPPALDNLVLKLLAPNPGERYQNSTELLTDLDTLNLVEEQLDVSASDPAVASAAPPVAGEQLELLQSALSSLLAVANEESIRLDNYYIGTEHLFLALLQSSQVDVVSWFQRLGQSPEMLAKTVRASVARGPGNIFDGTPLTPRAQHVLRLAGDAAEQANEPLVDCHLLQAILTEGQGIPVRILKSSGDWASIQSEILPLPHATVSVSTASDNLKQSIQPKSLLQKAKTATPLLAKFGRDLMVLVRNNEIGPVIGRTDELRQLIRTLVRREKNNPVLTGEAGVGKTAIVEGLAWRIVTDKIPAELRDRRIIELNMGVLVAGTKYRGEFEERLTNLIAEVKSTADVILFIDEIHTIVGAGEIEGGALDAANILKPALARGDLHCIGSTTKEEYDRYISNDPALNRRFRPINVPEPTQADAITILRGVSKRYEQHHSIPIDDAALITAVRLSARYLQDRYLPDKALDLLDEACARVRIRFDESLGGDEGWERRVTPPVITAVLADWLGIAAQEFVSDDVSDT